MEVDVEFVWGSRSCAWLGGAVRRLAAPARVAQPPATVPVAPRPAQQLPRVLGSADSSDHGREGSRAPHLRSRCQLCGALFVGGRWLSCMGFFVISHQISGPGSTPPDVWGLRVPAVA